MRKLTLKLWAEFALAVGCAFTGVTAVLWPDWIEMVFGVAPDNQSGSLEIVVALMSFIATASFITLARGEWRRVQSAGL